MSSLPAYAYGRKPLDDRMVNGFKCVWFDTIDKVGSNNGLPCCPVCKSILFETPKDAWWASVDRYEAAGNPGYRAMIEWAQGRHFFTFSEMKEAYEARDQGTVGAKP